MLPLTLLLLFIYSYAYAPCLAPGRRSPPPWSPVTRAWRLVHRRVPDGKVTVRSTLRRHRRPVPERCAALLLRAEGIVGAERDLASAGRRHIDVVGVTRDVNVQPEMVDIIRRPIDRGRRLVRPAVPCVDHARRFKGYASSQVGVRRRCVL